MSEKSAAGDFFQYGPSRPMFAIDYTDLGTPASTDTKQVTVEIDGVQVTVPEGTSVMRAAALAEVSVPKLCATDTLQGLRLLPPVPRRDRRPQGLPRLVHHHGGAGHEDQDPVREAHCSCVAASSISTSPITRSSATPARPTSTASCRTWPRKSASRRAPTPRARPTGRKRRPMPFTTPATRTSASTPSCASSARAVCARATKCRARSR